MADNYDFRKDDIVRLELARPVVGIRCALQGDRKYLTDAVTVFSSSAFRVIGYRGRRDFKREGLGKLYLENMEHARVGTFMIVVKPALDCNSIKVMRNLRETPSLEASAESEAA